MKTLLRKRGLALSFLLLLSSLGLFGCSDALNQLITPFDPDFSLEAHSVKNGIQINFEKASLPPTTIKGDASSSYDAFYAIYLYRAQNTPYGNYNLVKRIFNTEAAKSYIDVSHQLKQNSSSQYIDVTYTVRDFTLHSGFSHGAINEIFQGYGTTVDETVEKGKTYFYRVEIVQYKYRKENVNFKLKSSTIIKQDVSNTLDSHSISGWVEATFIY